MTCALLTWKPLLVPRRATRSHSAYSAYLHELFRRREGDTGTSSVRATQRRLDGEAVVDRHGLPRPRDEPTSLRFDAAKRNVTNRSRVRALVPKELLFGGQSLSAAFLRRM